MKLLVALIVGGVRSTHFTNSVSGVVSLSLIISLMSKDTTPDTSLCIFEK